MHIKTTLIKAIAGSNGRGLIGARFTPKFFAGSEAAFKILALFLAKNELHASLTFCAPSNDSCAAKWNEFLSRVQNSHGLREDALLRPKISRMFAISPPHKDVERERFTVGLNLWVLSKFLHILEERPPTKYKILVGISPYTRSNSTDTG